MKHNWWRKVHGVAINLLEHPRGGCNHQHIGNSSVVHQDVPSGQKDSLITTRRIGPLCGKEVVNVAKAGFLHHSLC